MELVEAQVCCPYCWQSLTLLLDPSISEVDYVEDCHICCQPIRVQARVVETGEVEWIEASRENE